MNQMTKQDDYRVMLSTVIVLPHSYSPIMISGRTLLSEARKGGLSPQKKIPSLPPELKKKGKRRSLGGKLPIDIHYSLHLAATEKEP